ncbi:MAG: hypothetical protein GY820_46935 [Gammaproteobacteria bacterium]|nr:hypothetical protein [Gammaproteobacteria bacterium]
MKTGDMVYYLYTDKHGTDIKFAASILTCNDDSYLIRVGRLDVHAQKIVTFESTVNSEKLLPRSTLCSYEDELKGAN